MHGVDTLWSGWVVLFANSQCRSTHFLAWPSISEDHEEILRFPEHGKFFSCSCGNSSDWCFVSFQPILCHPHTRIRITIFDGVQGDIHHLELFSQPCCNRIFSNCLSHNSPAKGWPYKFLSRGTTGSSILDHDLGHLCRGTRILMSRHSDLGIFNDLWAPSIFTWV